MCEKSIRYNWAGDIITRDTLVPNKRTVVGYKDRFIPTDIREWIRRPPNNKLSEALSEIPDLPEGKEASSFNRRARLIWDYVAKKITYVYDKEAHSLPDFWMLPEEVLTLKKGDCEDSTYLLCSLLLASGISPFCVRAVLGIVYDKKGNVLGGHAWPCYLDELGKWRLLESTLNTIPYVMPLADSLAKEGTEFRYEPMFCFNQYHLWLIKPSTTEIRGYLTISKAKIDSRR
ncbi:hypothetical protein ES702_03081 [subsurface metagenome]